MLGGFAEPNHDCMISVWQAQKQVCSLGDWTGMKSYACVYHDSEQAGIQGLEMLSQSVHVHTFSMVRF